MTKVYLCSIPFLNNSYNNVIDFKNSESRQNWFLDKTKKTIDTNFKYDNQRMYVVINEKFEDSRIYDYLWFNKEGRCWFYFIVGHEMITENTTKLLLESACFDCSAIRKTSRKIGLITDASLRYE